MPSNIFRDCSRKYASLIIAFYLWVAGGTLDGSFPASRSTRKLTLDVLLIKTIWISSRFFSKRIPQIQTTLPRTKAWILWWMTSMQCTCVSLAALSRNSLADSRSFKFFNSISNAWFNHFPDGLVHRGFEMISVQANVWAESNLSKALKPIQEEMAWNRCHGCRYCCSES